MNSFVVGAGVVILAIFADGLLGDGHPASVVQNLTWWQRLYRIRPSPLRIVYGVPVALIFPVWPLPVVLVLAGILAALYEYFAEQQRGLTPFGRFESEDVRDVVVGALIGWLLS